MAGFDFLHTTTYDPQMEDQQHVVDMLSQQAAAQDDSSNNPSNLQELSDEDMNDLVEQNDDEHEEVSDADGEKLATDTHDFENEDLDPIDYQLMGYLMGEGDSAGGGQSKPQMQYGGGTLLNADTVYGPNSNVNPVNKINSVKFASLTNNMSKYSSQLPQVPGARGNNGYESIKNSASQFVNNDPVAQKLGINVAKAGGGAYHVGYKAGGEQYAVGGKYTFPGMKMPRPLGIRQAGGGEPTLYANDDTTKRIGLNNENYQRAVLNLKGTNTIRGLDNHQPVAVTDGSKYKVLHGPQDTAQFNGKVYEKKV